MGLAIELSSRPSRPCSHNHCHHWQESNCPQNMLGPGLSLHKQDKKKWKTVLVRDTSTKLTMVNKNQPTNQNSPKPTSGKRYSVMLLRGTTNLIPSSCFLEKRELVNEVFCGRSIQNIFFVRTSICQWKRWGLILQR